MAKRCDLDRTVRASMSFQYGHKRTVLNDIGSYINFMETFRSEDQLDHIYGVELLVYGINGLHGTKNDPAMDTLTDQLIKNLYKWSEDNNVGYMHLNDSRYKWTTNVIRLRFYSKHWRNRARKALLDLVVLSRLEIS